MSKIVYPVWLLCLCPKHQIMSGCGHLLSYQWSSRATAKNPKLALQVSWHLSAVDGGRIYQTCWNRVIYECMEKILPAIPRLEIGCVLCSLGWERLFPGGNHHPPAAAAPQSELRGMCRRRPIHHGPDLLSEPAPVCGCMDLPWSCAPLIHSHSACRMQLDIMLPCLVLQAEEQGSFPSSLCLISVAIMNEFSILKFVKNLDLAEHSLCIFLFVIPPRHKFIKMNREVQISLSGH